jgi:elongation factor G
MEDIKKIRNICLAGHSGSGKTSVVEAMLFIAGETTRLGKIEEGNTISDFSSDEIERRISINSSVMHLKFKDNLIDIIDTPGYMDFWGEVLAPLHISDSTILVIDASSGIEIGTERVWEWIKELNIPVMIFINRVDKENADCKKVLSQIEQYFSKNCIPFNLPDSDGVNFSKIYSVFDKENSPQDIKEKGENYYQKIIDCAAESDDALLEKYLDKGELSSDEISKGIKEAVLKRKLFPILFGSATKDMIGIKELLEAIIDFLPSPSDKKVIKGKEPESEEEKEREVKVEAPFSGFVFKTIYDPYVGQLTLFRIYSGKLEQDTGFYNVTKRTKERIGKIYKLQGKQQKATPLAIAGEIVAVAKLKETRTNDSLCNDKSKIVFPPIHFPEAVVAASVKPKSKGDEDKIMDALHRLANEDLTFKVSREVQTKELLVSGLGDLHLEVMIGRLKQRFGVDVELGTPKVPYKETITKSAKAQGKYKRQTGGRGQYGDVWLEIEPLPRESGFEFVDKIVGGAVPKQYIPSVEKGVKQAMAEGVLAGYPMVDMKVTIYDGSFHPVDSSDIAFQIAGSLALKKASQSAGLVLLEPIMDVEVCVPDEFMGQISGDINSRRGRIMGVDAKPGMQVVKAQVPLGEMFRYASELRSMTGGKGTYTMKFSHYEIVPQKFAEKIIKHVSEEKK